MRRRRILLYKNGEADRDALGELGCYECWFARALPAEVTLEVHRGFERPRRPLSGYDGLLLSGSPRSLVEPEPWMDEAAELVREAARSGLATLGVCFGHQLIAHAFGGRVRRNPRGWEVGTVSVWLTARGRQDPLFCGLDEGGGMLRVNQSHRDEVAELGPGMTVLASNEHSAVQAVALGDHVRGVQFHPEMGPGELQRLVRQRQALLDAEAAQRGQPDRRAEAVLRRTAETPSGPRLLRNWLDHFARHA
ncbi:MAG: type 1 glutamine amidotransferase [Myxococcales bacterium]|nr:type 1 glutamine amidotransferase [Myxococcota bacterium]MDW8280201.1 type 1 glutamine amidotransferase [Myxococcales bacterium]